MMQAVLKFNLPEDNCEFEIASTAMKWALTVQDIDGELRRYLKYNHKFTTADEAIEKMRDKVHEIMEGRGINLEMIE